MAAPAIVNSNTTVNGASARPDPSPKPSVTISAAGAPGFIPNGGPVATQSRPNINFGSMNAAGSPAVVNSVPFHSQNSPLVTPQPNPRITSPGRSPSPIPQPAASGGRPPSAFQAQGNAPNFGSMGGADGDVSRQMQGNGPSGNPGPAHLRRQSSQSAHGDAINNNMQFPQGANRPGFMPGAGRGGRVPSYGPGFPPPGQFSPSQNFRPMNQRPNNNMPSHFQNQGHLGPQPNSPHMQPRSPGHQGSHPGTPQMQHMQMNPQMQFQPSYNAYSQHLSPQAGHFGIPPPFDQSYAYYQQGYQVHPQYLQQNHQQQGPPSSPRQYRQGPPTQQYPQGAYNQSPSQNMSRSGSQISERPTSVAQGQQQPPPPAATPGSQNTQTPSQKSATPAAPATPNFTIPSRKSKGIVIKNADGEIVTFEKKVSPPPARVRSTSPAKSTTTAPASTPSPRPARTSSRTPPQSKTGKTAAEIKADFLEQVKKGSQEDKNKEDDAAAAAAKAETDASDAKVKQEADAKLALEKEEATKKVEQQQAEERAVKEKELADKAIADKQAADKLEADKLAADKLAADKLAADKLAAEKAEAEKVESEKKEAEKLAAEKAATDQAASDKAAADKVESDRITAEAEATSKAEAEKEEAGKAQVDADKAKSDAEEEQRLKDEEFDRMIAEMEAAEAEEEERQRIFTENKEKRKAEELAQANAKSDAEMKKLEREAEAAEEARANNKSEDQESPEAKAEREKIFASLKKPEIGPGAEDSPASEEEDAGMEASKYAPSNQKSAAAAKPKPAALKLDTVKPVEPAQPTPGMQALKSARMLQLQNEKVDYPEGIKSPNPALIQTGKRAGRLYDMDFLLQFRDAFKEKPSVDWDAKLKDSVGDASDPGTAKSARTPSGMGPRGVSARPNPPSAYQVMGSFGQGGGGRTLPPGTTSQIRFEASQRGSTMSNPLAGMAGRPGGFQMGNAPIGGGRQPSMGSMHSPRANTSARKGTSRQNGDRNMSRKDQEKQNASMPLTAGADLKPIEVSQTGWKPTSVGRVAPAGPDPSGHMAPDMVQRKVKAALNKMTPERFDKIADQILEIAAQSKNEADGRTLRQVIQLTFDKACDEAHWASMYAKFCARMLEDMSSEIKDETIRDKNDSPVVGGTLFRKYLLNRCQEEFERGWNVNLPDKKEGESDEAAMLSDEYYIAAAAKRKGLGLVQFIGELYKLRMLSIKIMHQCFLRLLDFEGMPDETAVESLVKLLRTVGGTMAQSDNGPSLLEQYFSRIDAIMKMDGLPSRMHYMLLDMVDVRKNGWHTKDDAKGPKTIQEIRDEAAIALQKAEVARQQQSQRGGGGRMPAGRGDARNFGGQMAPPDYPRNQVATDDLRRLGNRRQASSNAPAKMLGPSSMFSSRSNSGRPSALGAPGSMNRGDESGASSRTASRKDEKKEEAPKSAVNAFSALESLDGEIPGEASPVASPTLKNAQPASLDAEAATATSEATTAGEDTTTSS